MFCGGIQVYKHLIRQKLADYTLRAPQRENGNIRAPSRQQIATWCVEAWDEIPERLVIKAFLKVGITTPEMYENVGQQFQQLPAELLEHCCLDEELQPLLVDEFENGDELAMAIAEESGDDGEEDHEDEAGSWAPFVVDLQQRGFQPVEAVPDEEQSLCKRRIAFMWEPPFGWSIGYIESRAKADDQRHGFRYSVRYGDTVYPQALLPQKYCFGEDAVPGSWVLLTRRRSY